MESVSDAQKYNANAYYKSIMDVVVYNSTYIASCVCLCYIRMSYGVDQGVELSKMLI